MTTYTMILEKVCVLTDTVEVEADSLEEAKAKFEENGQEYFEDADFDFLPDDDSTLIRPYLWGIGWDEANGKNYERLAWLEARVHSTEI